MTQYPSITSGEQERPSAWASPSPCLQFSAFSHRIANGVVGVVLVLAAASVLVVGGLSLKWPIVQDTPLLHYVGWLMHQGAVPYRDAFEMNFPGTYLIHWLVLCIPGDVDLVWRCFDLVLLSVTVVLIFRLFPARHYWSTYGACIAFALYYLCLGPIYGGGQRDMIMTPFMVGGVLATVALLEETDRRVWHAFVAGLLFGAATTIKPTGALMGVMEMGFAAIFLFGGGRGWKRLVPVLAASALGLFLPMLAMLVWLYFAGGLAAFLDIASNYVPLYRLIVPTDATPLIVSFGYPSNFALAAVAVLSSYVVFTRRLTPRFGAVLVALAVSLCHFVLQQKGCVYHLIPAMAFAIPAAFWMFDEAIASREVWRWSLGVLVAAGLILPHGQAVRRIIKGDIYVKERHAMVEELAGYLKANLSPGETVQVCDTSIGGIDALLRAGARQPTRFIYDFHFYLHGRNIPYVEALKSEYMSSLIRGKPRYVIVFWESWCIRDYARINVFPEFKDWLNKNYVQRIERAEYRIFERKENGGRIAEDGTACLPISCKQF